MEWFILIAIIFVLFIFLLRRKTEGDIDYPYEQHEVLFSAAERSFYGVLCEATKDKAIVFGKVRVGDVLKWCSTFSP